MADTLEVNPTVQVLAPGKDYTRMKVYIAGPMTGRPHFNFPAFDIARATVEMHGFDAVSPADLDEYGTRATAIKSPDGAPGSGGVDGATWGDFLARDVKVIADEVDGVVLMPEWETSKGARLEAFVCRHVGKPVFYLNDFAGRAESERADWPDDVDSSILAMVDHNLYHGADGEFEDEPGFPTDYPWLIELDDAELDAVLTLADLQTLERIEQDQEVANV